MKWAPVISICILSGMMLYSCSTRQPEFRDIKNVRIAKAGFKSTTLSLNVLMYNPNSFGLELSETDLDIFLDNTYFGHSGQRFKIAIPRKAEFKVPITLEVNSKNFLKNGLNALFNKKIELKIKGAIRLGKSGIYKTINIDYTGTHEVSLSNLF